MLAPAEQAQLIDFLDQGKGLYIEGCDFAAHNNGTAFFQRFGCAFVSNGNPATTGNVSSVTGQAGSIVEGKGYSYLYQQPPDAYVDDIDASGGAVIFQCQANCGRAVSYAGPGGTYRAICSAFLFGGLREGTNTKTELLGIYLNYLNGAKREAR